MTRAEGTQVTATGSGGCGTATPALQAAALLLATLLAATGHAAGNSYDTLLAGCASAHPEDRAAYTLCLQEAALAVNLQVDARYTALREARKGDQARRLLNAQRAFVRFRDQHCTAIGRAVDATAWQACNLRLTLDRLAQLERYPEP